MLIIININSTMNVTWYWTFIHLYVCWFASRITPKIKGWNSQRRLDFPNFSRGDETLLVNPISMEGFFNVAKLRRILCCHLATQW